MIKKIPNRLLLRESKGGKRLAKYSSFIELKKQYPREIISEILSVLRSPSSLRIKKQISDFSLVIRKSINKNPFSNNSATYTILIKSKSGEKRILFYKRS